MDRAPGLQAGIDFIEKWIDEGCPDEATGSRKSQTSGCGARTSLVALMTLAELMSISSAQRDLSWLRDALQFAVRLELSTLPPYLTARWTIKDQSDPVAKSLREVRGEEMCHMGLACNLLVAIGGSPLIANAEGAPTYPGQLPGGVRPGVAVSLLPLSVAQAKVFMDIEYPDGGPIATVEPDFDSIGAFYSAIRDAFWAFAPPLDVGRQLEGPLGLFKIDKLDKAVAAIEQIKVQGEGSRASPEEQPGDLAHYYKFGEIYHGRRLVRSHNGRWAFDGAEVPLPEVWPMAEVPAGGYLRVHVPDAETWSLIETFDHQYSAMLRLLEAAWQHGDVQILSEAIGQMIQMSSTGRRLVTRPRPDGLGNYGPCFRLT